MGQVRCEICRARLPTQQGLRNHYLHGHSKFTLAREILVQCLKNTVPKVCTKKTKRKAEKEAHVTAETETQKTETVFARDSVQILYRDNDIIIRDDKSSVDMEFSFDENSNEATENSAIPNNTGLSRNKALEHIQRNTEKDANNHKKGKQLKKLVTWQNKNATTLIVNASSSSASSEDSLKKFSFDKKIKKRRSGKGKPRHYKINITRTKNCHSLDENTGKFYQCSCRQNGLHESTLNRVGKLKLESDTETASDASKTNGFNEAKVFCIKCGNGYKNERLLADHMKIHERHCRVCNTIFPTEEVFKQHIQTHMFKVFVCHICNYEFPIKEMLQRHFDTHVEDSILDSVIDMEQDYNLKPCPLLSLPYQESINSILRFLTLDENETHPYDAQLLKICCDMCLTEVFSYDYQNHMQNVHQIYGCN